MTELSAKLHPHLLKAYSWKHARKRVYSFAEQFDLRPGESQSLHGIVTWDDTFQATHPNALNNTPPCVVCGTRMYKMRDLSQIPDVFPSIWVCESCYQGSYCPPCKTEKERVRMDGVKQAILKIQPLADEYYAGVTLQGKSQGLRADLQCIKQCRFRQYPAPCND